ncbi:ferrichrome ABC transporter permease [Enemella evansiae]|uniref:Ferrichrome ABC transporter permease n=1 Tax=Enemella evansiae TaxID=2016499 RepID=A0A255GJA9_9ACTN|nr:ferrichrome ABC transporter permease [Enemella evansiae]OYO15948.1 ferrichrome ABC transporter permease [Enemella evansiae]TDO89973.1 iron complex transport system permease protein [Enemella evansiae]
MAMRRTVTWIVLVALLVLVAGATLALGRLGIGPAEVFAWLGGDAPTRVAFVLERLRGPRLVVALCAGAALGMAGWLFQGPLRNPLASPDIIGVTAGAGAGAVLCQLLTPTVPVQVGAVVGALAAVTLTYLATGTGFRSPARMVLAGIGVAGLSLAVVQLVVAIVLRDRAMALVGYLTGSLNARDPGHALLAVIALVVGFPITWLVAERVRVLELGDDLASGLGAPPGASRTALIGLGVFWCAVAVSVAGPVAFVALAAPQIARRLVGIPGELVATALVGALLLSAADLAVQQAPLVSGLPVGVLTAGLGGIYLGGVLATSFRRANR